MKTSIKKYSKTWKIVKIELLKDCLLFWTQIQRYLQDPLTMSLFSIDIFSRALVLDVSFDKFMNYNDNILLFSKINCLLINSMYWICSFLLLLTNLVKRLPKIVTISELSYFFLGQVWPLLRCASFFGGLGQWQKWACAHKKKPCQGR